MSNRDREIGRLQRFLGSFSFAKGLIITLSAGAAIAIGDSISALDYGIFTALGVLLTAPSDIPGNRKHHLLGLLVAIGLITFNMVAMHAAVALPYAVLPTLGILMFFNAYLSVYGFRASLVSLSGMLAIALSFARPADAIELWTMAGCIAAGGFWYLSVSSLVRYMRPQQYSEELLHETMQLTADYLNTRSRLLLDSGNRKELMGKLLDIETLLIDKHESLRSVLLHDRSRSGTRRSLKKQLLLFIELIDVMELAVANPVDYEMMDREFDKHRKPVVALANLTKAMSEEIERLSLRLIGSKSGRPAINLDERLLALQEAFEDFRDSSEMPRDRQRVLTIRNLLDYVKKQRQHVNNIARMMYRSSTESPTVESGSTYRFITPQEYTLKTLTRNFNYGSPIFKHSLRIAVTAVAGFYIGDLLTIQNPYWIVLTIVVIMRPNYGLTKQRSRDRVIGTLLGGFIAAGIILLTTNALFFVVAGALSMILSFSFIQQNARVAAVFITLTIVFLFGLSEPNAFEVIEFRVLDTIIGALLAITANLTLFPAWEYQNLQSSICESIDANRKYLEEVRRLYNEKGDVPVEYRLSRKRAFNAMGNLNGAFQRMTQEPKSVQKNFIKLYEIVVLQHAFLSHTAALGTFIRTHQTTEASDQFNKYVNGIIEKLDWCYNRGGDKRRKDNIPEGLESALDTIRSKYQSLQVERDSEIEQGNLEISSDMRARLQEGKMVIDQLEYLNSLATKLSTAMSEYYNP